MSDIARPGEEEVSDIFVVSFSLVMHFCLDRRGGLTVAKLAVERFALRGRDKCSRYWARHGVDWRFSPLAMINKEHSVFVP